MAFEIRELNGKSYRKNINPNGNCKYYSEIRCICCNDECDFNVSIDDLLTEQIEDEWNKLDR